MTESGKSHNGEENNDSFSVIEAVSGLIDRAKKKIVSGDDEKEPATKQNGAVSGAIGRMSMGAMFNELKSMPPVKEAMKLGVKTVDIVIVGAGLAGLTAAYNIHKADRGLNVVVLEAKDRLGGRLLTKEMTARDGIEFYDFGWQWISSSHKNVMQLLEELDLQTYEQRKKGKTFYQSGEDPVVSLNQDTKPFGPIDNYDFDSLIAKLEVLRKTITMQDPTCCKNAKELDTITLQHFVDQNTWFEAPRHYFETLVMVIMGVSPREMSLLFFLFALSSAGGWDSMIGAGDDKVLKIKGGSQRICDLLANKIDRMKVVTSDAVVSITQPTDEKMVHIKTENGREYRANQVIVSVPPKYASRIDFQPPMPTERQCIIDRMPGSTCIAFVVTYDERFWKHRGFSGRILRIVDEDLSKTESNSIPFSAVIDATSMDGNPALMGYVHASYWAGESVDDRRDGIVTGLKKFFGIEALDYLSYSETDWGAEPYISCYPSCSMTPGAITNYFHSLVKTFDRYASQHKLPEHFFSLRNSFDRVHWAGAETATVWYGHMDGAVASGKRAAKEVMSHIRPEVNIDHID